MFNKITLRSFDLIRLYLLLALALAGYFAWRKMTRQQPDIVDIYLKKYGLLLFVAVLLLLTASGKLNWLFALIGVGLTFISRALPFLFKHLPHFQSLWSMFTTAQPNREKQPPPATDEMNTDEAYRILGLTQGATEQQIIAAHKRLMQKLHPDRGGSDYLASKINQAKAVLLKNKL